jgi:two-component system, chemotaxis family, protein-glutamate methylesterase/glutaminase
MLNSRLVVVGASLGGVSALRRLCGHLPKDFAAPICIVLHVGAHESILPKLLSSAGALPAVHPSDGQRLEPGRIYVAPPDNHLRVDDGVVRLTRGPKEHHARPAIDPLFRSAARSCGSRTIGVVLTGLLDDGTPGMQAIKEQGGTCVVQDPAEAEAASMPASVLKYVAVDHCVRLDDLAPLLSRLAKEPPQQPARMPSINRTTHEDDVSRGIGNAMEHLRAIGSPSTFSCPDCSGTLWQIAGVTPRRYLCHTGHAFTLESLRSAQSLGTDEALWSAIRALQEKRELVLQALNVATEERRADQEDALRDEAASLDISAKSLRRLLEEG